MFFGIGEAMKQIFLWPEWLLVAAFDQAGHIVMYCASKS